MISESEKRDVIRRAKINKAIREAGHKFIRVLQVKNIANRLHGVQVLVPYDKMDEATGDPTFGFIQRGGRTSFEIEESTGEFVCKILDCKENREFLASHIRSGYWEIEDSRIRSEIEDLARKKSKRAVTKIRYELEVAPESAFQQDVAEGPKDTELSTEEVEENAGEVEGETGTEEITEEPEPVVQKSPKKSRQIKKSFATIEE